MNNNKSTVIGWILIFAVMVGFIWMNQPTEEQLAELNEKLASPEIACDYVKAGELAEETERLKAKLRELYEAWEEAQKQLELLKKEN